MYFSFMLPLGQAIVWQRFVLPLMWTYHSCI